MLDNIDTASKNLTFFICSTLLLLVIHSSGKIDFLIMPFKKSENTNRLQ